jgi:ketosteroid isomerase-like protein
MKVFMGYLVVLLSLGSAALSQAQTPSATEKAVAALEQQWFHALKSNNPELIATNARSLLAEKFVGTGTDGKVENKTEATASAKAAKYESAETEDLKVTVFGHTAIATMTFNAKGTDESGKPFDTHERWTDTWVKMPSGRWQCVASHGSPIKM